MRLYNTLTRQVEEIEPQNPSQVGIYTCGPTVYDYPHIGNWFTFIRYDLLVRTLKAAGFEPNWVLNITDVGHLVSDADEGEDKLEKGARREGKTAWEVANFYTEYFLNGLKRLNFTQPNHLPRATEHINEQIELVKKLEEKGYTYQIDDGIYYDTSRFPRYADFARLDLDEQQPGARIDHNPQKRNSSDFALWKFSPDDRHRDMEWDSPWGKGFPGWHIECSAMIHKYFGDTVDIHSGGIDHVPVHHTNEIAQSEAVTGKPLARYWMHTNHILIDDEKISKSKSNGITLEDIEEKGFNLEEFRFLVLQSHYRSQSKFSWVQMSSAKNSLKSIQNGFNWILWSKISNDKPLANLSGFFNSYEQKIRNRLIDDLNTPEAIADLHQCSIEFGAFPASVHDIDATKDFANFISATLGISIFSSIKLSDEQERLIAYRNDARLKSDWPKADEIRDELARQGVGLNDTDRHGTIPYQL